MVLYHPAQEMLTSFAKRRPWFFVSELSSLVEHHPGFDEATTTEHWLSIFIHEYFHTRQFLQGSAYVAWGKIIRKELNPRHLTALYKRNVAYRDAVTLEIRALRAAVEIGPSKAQARTALSSWLHNRHKRIQRFQKAYPSPNLDHDDMAYTYIEGVARYVENTYLVDAKLHPDTALLKQDPRFTGFKQSSGKGLAGMNQVGVPQGQYYYATGLYVGLLLDVIDPSWTQVVHQHPRWIVGLAEDVVEGRSIGPR